MSFIDRMMEAEHERWESRWAEFWRNYKPLQPAAPPRRPTDAEIERYLERAAAAGCDCPTPCPVCRCQGQPQG